jgi:uncharacterized membrane protein
MLLTLLVIVGVLRVMYDILGVDMRTFVFGMVGLFVIVVLQRILS